MQCAVIFHHWTKQIAIVWVARVYNVRWRLLSLKLFAVKGIVAMWKNDIFIVVKIGILHSKPASN